MWCWSISVEAFCERRTVSIIFLQQIIKPKLPALLMFLLKYKHFECYFQTLFQSDFGTSTPT